MKKEESFMTNLTKFYILMMLHESPRHGYDIIEELGRRTGKKPSAGQVYPLLKSFQKSGYVTVKTERIGKKSKKIYKITREGRNFASGILKKFSNIMDVAIKRKVKMCAHCNCEIYRGGHHEKSRGKELYFCCKNCAKAFK